MFSIWNIRDCSWLQVFWKKKKKKTFSLVGLSLHLICQVLPLLLFSIQTMQIKHFTDSLGLDLTNIYTCDLSKLSHTAHRHTTVRMPKYLQDGRINVPSESTEGILVYLVSLYSSLHMREYFYLFKKKNPKTTPN